MLTSGRHILFLSKSYVSNKHTIPPRHIKPVNLQLIHQDQKPQVITNAHTPFYPSVFHSEKKMSLSWPPQTIQSTKTTKLFMGTHLNWTTSPFLWIDLHKPSHDFKFCCNTYEWLLLNIRTTFTVYGHIWKLKNKRTQTHIHTYILTKSPVHNLHNI